MDLRLQIQGASKAKGTFGRRPGANQSLQDWIRGSRGGSKAAGWICNSWNVRPKHGVYGKYKHLGDVRRHHFEAPSRIVRKIHASGRLRPLPEGAEEEKNAKVTRGSDVICKSGRFALRFFEKYRDVPSGCPGFKAKKRVQQQTTGFGAP